MLCALLWNEIDLSIELLELGIDDLFQTTYEYNQCAVKFRLRPDVQEDLAPDNDTLQLCDRFNLDPVHNEADLEKEILLAHVGRSGDI